MAAIAFYRRAPFGSHGKKVIAFFCAWELIALPSQSPIPTISETVDRHPWFGLVLLGLLGHHWYVEFRETVMAVVDDL